MLAASLKATIDVWVQYARRSVVQSITNKVVLATGLKTRFLIRRTQVSYALDVLFRNVRLFYMRVRLHSAVSVSAQRFTIQRIFSLGYMLPTTVAKKKIVWVRHTLWTPSLICRLCVSYRRHIFLCFPDGTGGFSLHMLTASFEGEIDVDLEIASRWYCLQHIKLVARRQWDLLSAVQISPVPDVCMRTGSLLWFLLLYIPRCWSAFWHLHTLEEKIQINKRMYLPTLLEYT